MSGGFGSRISRSVFLKLLVIFSVTGFLLLVATAGLLRLVFFSGNPAHETWKSNIQQYAIYLARDLGEPPAFEKARELSNRLGLDIRYESAGVRWSTDPALPDFERIEGEAHRMEPRTGPVRQGRFGHGVFLWLEQGKGRFLFMPRHNPLPEPRLDLALAMLAALALILSGCYCAVNWIFRPLRWLTQGVKELGHGNLDHQVPVRKHDEFSELGRSFNQMTSRIREMVRAKEQLLLDVSHELRSPLTRIRVGLEFIHPEENRIQLGREVVELDSMIEEILEQARLDSPHGGLVPASVDLVTLVKESMLGFKERKPGIVLADCLPEAVLHLDAARMRVVLRNLLENAVKYSSEQPRPAELSVRSAGTAIELRLRDHGPGIPEPERQLIFEPFYRTDKSRNKSSGGYGLGLSLCRKIVLAHRGEIRIDAAEGSPGTVVVITFPFPSA